MAEKSRRQELEAVGHMASTARKQSEMNTWLPSPLSPFIESASPKERCDP